MSSISGANIGDNYKGILNLGAVINTPLSTTLQAVTDGDGNTTPLQLATNRIALGTSTGTSLLNFPDAGTTAADGIGFGSAISLFRTGSEAMRLNSTSFELYSPTNARVSHWLSSSGRVRLINNIGGGTTFFDFDSGAGSSSIDFGGNNFILKSGASTRFEILSTGGQVNITPPTLTGSSATSALSITQTWNTTGNPTAIFANITNTASGATSNLMDLQVGGIPQFTIKRNYEVITRGIFRVQDNSGNNAMIMYGEPLSGIRTLWINGSVGIGILGNNASAKLQIDATNQGFLPPRMTTAQKLAIASPAEGLEVYDLTLHQKSYYNGTIWVDY